LHSFSPAYDNDEPDYDPEEPAEPDVETAQVDDIEIGENPDQLLTTGDSSRGVVSSGEPTAAGNRGKGGPKDKRIPNDKRTTTPYMTKYERARILGTRALQIR
jgi:DNA-directed RNA polymerase I, II, and III subunit RPABC2